MISLSLLSLFLVGIGFVTTSKREYNPNTIDYYKEPSVDAKIRVMVTLNSQDFAPFRKTAFIGLIPDPDIRWGQISEAGASLYDDNKFYCVVTITASGCSEWKWIRVMDATNTDSAGNMKVKLPPNGTGDIVVKIEYYERPSGGTAFQFNTQDNTRLKYIAQEIFLGRWNSNIPQPITLKPVSLSPQFRMGPVDASFNKGSGFGDLNGINQYIDLNIIPVP